MEVTRHFVSSTYIIFENKVLLHFHKKLKLWLPVGGHIERDELPEVAALREAFEESGLQIKLYSDGNLANFINGKMLVRPMQVILEDINQFHQHIDSIFYATSETDILSPEDGDSKKFKWMTADEVKKLDAPDNVKYCALEALKLLKT